MSQYSVVSCCTKADVLLVVCQAVHDMPWALICGRLLGMTNMPHASFVFDKLIPEALEKLALDQIYNGNWQWLVFGPSKPWIFQFNQFYYPLGNAQYIWLEEQEHHGFKSGGWYRGILDGCFILKQTEMLHLWNIYLYSIHGASAKDFGPSWPLLPFSFRPWPRSETSVACERLATPSMVRRKRGEQNTTEGTCRFVGAI